MEGYVFVTSGPERLLEIAEDSLKIEGVKMAHSVTGQFDVVAYIEFTDMDMLKRILDGFQSIEGVERTQTAVAIPPRLSGASS
jgi:DNA-binding Lrp family transcriptional regulator